MSDEHRKARRRGKDMERIAANALGGKRRIGYKGTACSDIDGLPWSVEVTRTKKGLKALGTKWAQAVRNAKLEGQEPVLIVAGPRQRLKDAFVGCRFSLFQKLANPEEIILWQEYNGVRAIVTVRNGCVDLVIGNSAELSVGDTRSVKRVSRRPGGQE